MIDPVKILQRAWHILWNYRTLWIFGLILALAAGGTASSHGGNNNIQHQNQEHSYQLPSYGSPREFFQDVGRQLNQLFTQGIPAWNISGQELTAFLWTVAVFVLFMLLISLVVAAAYYVSVNATIRMVDEYENTGTKMTFGQALRIGWSRTAWRVFLINLIVNLPWLLFLLALLVTGITILLRIVNGNMTFTPVVIVVIVGLLFVSLFMVFLLSFIPGLLRPFFWRVSVLEGAGVGESLRRGFAMVRENWKSAGLMWLVMIGLGIAWIVVSIIAAILTLPIVLITVIIAAAVVAIPALLLIGVFSLFLSGPLPWIAGALFVLPLFFLIAFSPWLMLGSWKTVYTSTVWTLTYREMKALPALTPGTNLQPAGD